MPSFDRRSLLKASTSLAVIPLSGCLEWARCRDVGGERLPEPHRVVLEAVRDDPGAAFPIELTYDFEDVDIAEDDPARLSVTLRNTGDVPVTIEADPPWPFGVHLLIREDTDEYQRITAWNDAMADSEHLNTCDKAVVSWEEVFVQEDLDAGETVSETYEIYVDSPGIAAGIYSTFISSRAKDENTVESHTIFFDEIIIEPINVE